MEVLALAFSDLPAILLAAFGLGLVIFIHELGHFATAKWCGVKVEKFSIGFGPAIWKFKRGETDYVLALLPLGGFVKMLGQDDADPGQMTDREVALDPRSYTAKTVPQRMAIISAGVINNLVSAVLFFIIAYLLGIKYQPAVIGGVTPGMPAWQADLRMGDVITRIDDRMDDNLSFTDVRLAVALSNKDQELEIAGFRGGEPFTTRVRPLVEEDGLVPTIYAEPMQSLQVPDPKDGNAAKLTNPGLSAARAEPPFAPGDTIVELNGIDLKNDYTRMAQELAVHRSEPVTFGVRRKGASSTDPLTEIRVEPNHFRTFGLKMAIGQITAIRRGSPAERAGFAVGDTITQIKEPEALVVGTDIDPLQLPEYFAGLAGKTVTVKISRPSGATPPPDDELNVIPDDRPGWIERPNPAKDDCPLSIPALGIAYHVLHTVADVTPEGPAAQAGISAGDHIVKIIFTPAEESQTKRQKPFEIEFDKVQRNWPHTFWQMQHLFDWKISLVVKSPKSEQPVTCEITPVEDPDWYLPIRGLAMDSKTEIRKAKSVSEAATLGFRRTRDSLIEMWFTIRGLFTGRISHKALGGPIRIAETAFFFSQQGIPDLILFMGILSVSLATLNFLPIPVLDGGHFVFLCWEGIRGKPPSPRVIETATYVGFAFILSLMAFVFYIDISSYFVSR
ncbi:MAG: site-2 protease family protein [Planctomycetes bacterium]|nr:site-2 protease family protein [Planctomycetota bacterium]